MEIGAMRNRAFRPGFSVIELLVVIAIIAVLIGLIVPGIQTARAAANRIQCANNLHQIGIAYHAFLDARGGRPSWFKSDSTWMDQLKPFLDNQEVIFACASAPPADGGNSETGPIWTAHDSNQFVTFQTYAFPSDHVRGDALSAVTYWLDPTMAELDNVEGLLISQKWLTFWIESPANYGVNSLASEFTLANDSQKVLVIEYGRAVIRPGVGQGSAVWPTDAALRHGGTLNVLMTDGSVQGMQQDEINPTVEDVFTQFWQPWKMR